MNTRLDLTVLLFCHNEEEALPKVIGDIRAALQGGRYAYEILVVDDGSTDRSASIAQDLSCRVLRHGLRRGAGAACKTGIRSAQGAIIAMLDADGTYTAADIPKMLDYFPDFDQVNGARTSEQGTMRLLRMPAKWLVRMFASLLVRQRIPDLQTGLKASKRDVMLPYLGLIPDRFSYATLMTIIFLCAGKPVKFIPTEYHERIGRSKFHPIRDTFCVVMNICRLIWYFDPLRILIPVAVLLILGGLGLLLYDLYFAVPGH